MNSLNWWQVKKKFFIIFHQQTVQFRVQWTWTEIVSEKNIHTHKFRLNIVFTSSSMSSEHKISVI